MFIAHIFAHFFSIFVKLRACGNGCPLLDLRIEHLSDDFVLLNYYNIIC